MATKTIDGQTVTIPKNAFDCEYMTEWRREVEYLRSKGIRYTFRKVSTEYRIPQYKYTKTPELFLALAEFYTLIKREKEFNSAAETMDVPNVVRVVNDTTFERANEALKLSMKLGGEA